MCNTQDIFMYSTTLVLLIKIKFPGFVNDFIKVLSMALSLLLESTWNVQGFFVDMQGAR